MASMETINEPGDIVYTIAGNGEVKVWVVQPDATLVPATAQQIHMALKGLVPR